MIAVLTLSGLVPLLVHLVIGGLIIWLLIWPIGYVGLPEPFNKIARAIVVLIAVVWLINVLLSLDGHAFIQ